MLFPHFNFNSVVINKYIDGNNFIPMHSDNEKCMKQNSDILTVSLGGTITDNYPFSTNKQYSYVSINHVHITHN